MGRIRPEPTPRGRIRCRDPVRGDPPAIRGGEIGGQKPVSEAMWVDEHGDLECTYAEAVDALVNFVAIAQVDDPDAELGQAWPGQDHRQHARAVHALQDGHQLGARDSRGALRTSNPSDASPWHSLLQFLMSCGAVPCRQGPNFKHIETLKIGEKRTHRKAWTALQFSAKHLGRGFAANVCKTNPHDCFILEDMGCICGGFEATELCQTLGQIDHVDVAPPEMFSIGLMNDASLTRVRSLSPSITHSWTDTILTLNITFAG